MVKMGVMGQSGHKNITDYRGGVLVGNWYENTENRLMAATGEKLLGFGAPFKGEATTAAAQHLEGRAGAELTAAYARTDLTRVGKSVPASQKFSHGDPYEAPVECFATVNQLAFGEKCLGEPPVQQYLWSAKTKLNASVPISNMEGSSSSNSNVIKRSQWSNVADDNMYTTTSQEVSSRTTMQASASAATCRAPLAVPASENGSAPVGRKPVGPFKAELDKNYHLIGLRK